jgi:hypothetical protein
VTLTVPPAAELTEVVSSRGVESRQGMLQLGLLGTEPPELPPPHAVSILRSKPSASKWIFSTFIIVVALFLNYCYTILHISRTSRIVNAAHFCDLEKTHCRAFRTILEVGVNNCAVLPKKNEFRI